MPKKTFYAGERGARGQDRTQFHVLLSTDERRKLVRLSHKMKMNAAEVVRALIMEAKT